MPTITRRTAGATLPPADTPGVSGKFPAPAAPRPAGTQDAAAALAAWAALAPKLAGTPRMRVSRDGGRSYRRRRDGQALTAANPCQPATIPVFDADTETGMLIPADFDVGRAAGTPDPAALVTAEAADFDALIASLGGRTITDVSPSGGRHVLVPFAEPLPWQDIRDVTRALARRYQTLDPAPVANAGGQIRPPGARHKTGGWQALTIPLHAAVAAVQHPCGPQVWNGLLDELAAELAAVRPVAEPASIPDGATAADDGTPWLPREGGRTPLSPALEAIARTGTWPRGRYAGRSEARMAVITGAAACGWRLSQVHAEITSGRWAGLAALYARPRERQRLHRLLPEEWATTITDLITAARRGLTLAELRTGHRKTPAPAAGMEDPQNSHTSDIYPRRPPTRLGVDFDRRAAEFGEIRGWVTITDAAAADPHRTAAWGKLAIPARLVLAAIGQAAMVAGSTVIEFGIRQLALYAGVNYRTVGRVLEMLRDEPDPLLDLVSRHYLWRADRYQLRIPDMYKTAAQWRRRRAGKIEAIHPVFAVLHGPAALTYTALTAEEVPAAEVARTARLAESTTAAALRTLAEHGLACHGRRGWYRGPVALDTAAGRLGADRIQEEKRKTYRSHRDRWHEKIASWLAAPEISYRDDTPQIPIDDILDQLEPPNWCNADTGPPDPGTARMQTTQPMRQATGQSR